MKKIWLLITLVFCSTTSASICDSPLPSTSLKEAILKCQLKSAAKDVSDISKKVESETAFLDYCQLINFSDKDGGKSLCKDPAGIICQYDGKVLDSNCSYTPDGSDVVMNDPQQISLFCKKEKSEETSLLTVENKAKCASVKLSGDECIDYLSFTKEELPNNEFNNRIFTDDKINQLFQIGETVKGHFRDLIQQSTHMSEGKKKFLIGKINRTSIYVNQDRFSNPVFQDCYGSEEGKLSTGAFNTTDYYGRNQIHLCSGLIQNMDYMNPHAFLHIIAHEFAHSIDPCAIEGGEDPRPNEYKAFYPELVSCLRGTKKGKCKGSKLNCREEGSAEKYCKDTYKDKSWKICAKEFKKTPNCNFGKGHGFKEEQINEGFADFIAAEVMGKIMKDATSKQRSDALISITAQLSRRHDSCNQGPRTDSHPNVYQRVNDITLSSDSGRKAFGCPGEGNKTCPGL